MKNLCIGLLALLIGFVPKTPLAQIVFPPQGCEFQVFFLNQPKISTASAKDAHGNLVRAMAKNG